MRIFSILLLSSFLFAPSVLADEAKKPLGLPVGDVHWTNENNPEFKLHLSGDVGAIVNGESNSKSESTGSQARARLYVPLYTRHQGLDVVPAILTGSIGRVGEKAVGSAQLDLGSPYKFDPTETPFGIRLGYDASPQTINYGLTAAIRGGTKHERAMVGFRLPGMGGVIEDRATGAAMFATGVKAEYEADINDVLSFGAGIEGLYLFGGNRDRNGEVDGRGLYVSPSASVTAKLGQNAYVRADGAIQGIQYKSVSEEADGSTPKHDHRIFGVTGTISAGVAY